MAEKTTAKTGNKGRTGRKWEVLYRSISLSRRLFLLAACAVHNRIHPVQLHQIVLDRFVLCIVPLVLVLAPLLSLAV